VKILLGALLGMLVWATAVAQGDIDDAEDFFPQRLTAQELLRHCVSSSMTDRGRQQQRYCFGFVSGVEEGLRLSASGLRGRTPAPFCVPPGEAARSITDAYIRYAGRGTTDLGKPAALIVIEALEKSYPCTR
jgi:hypothetical protein